MKKFLIAVLVSAALVAAGPLWAGEVVERILAVVNDEIVTDQDLEFIMAPVAAQYRTRYSGAELEDRLAKLREDYLRKAIDDKLVLSQAKKLQVIVKDEEVDEMITEVRNKFPDRERFLQALAEQGMTEKKLWNRFHDQLMTQKLVNYEVRSRISVSPGEVSAYYKNNPDYFANEDRVELKQILIREGSRTPEEAKSFADSLVAKLKQGQSFEELAKNFSEGAEAADGGQMGWISRGQLMGDIDQQVFSLKPGEVTEPLHSSLGYHIFKVVQKEQSTLKPLAEVKDEIQDLLFKQKLKQRLEAWTEGLKKNAYISIRP